MRGRELLFNVPESSVPANSNVMLIFGEIDCRAHARRKFVEAESEAPQAVRLVLGLSGHLYRYE